MVEVLVQGQQRAVYATLVQVPRVVPQADGLDPVEHLVIGPDQHVWRTRAQGDRCGPAGLASSLWLPLLPLYIL